MSVKIGPRASHCAGRSARGAPGGATSSLARLPGSQGRPARSRPGLRVYERAPGCLPGCGDGARALRVGIGLSRVATSTTFGARHNRFRAAEANTHDPRQLARDIRRTARPRCPAGGVGQGSACAAGGKATQGGEGKHGRKRLARLMRAAGPVGASRRGGTVVTTRCDRQARPAPDLIDRDFAAIAANQLWVADITLVPTATGFSQRPPTPCGGT